MCVNLKLFNKITVKHNFPMPGFDKLLDRLQVSGIFGI